MSGVELDPSVRGGDGPSGLQPSNGNSRNTQGSSRMKRDALLGGEQEGRRVVISDEEFRDKNLALKEEKLEDDLQFVSVDLNLDANRQAHNTHLFDMKSLILRRGQEFTISLTFDRNVNREKDVIVLQFVTGARPQESKGTVVRVPVNFGDQPAALTWSAKVIEVREKTVKVEVISDDDCNIGKYEIFVETKLKDSDKEFTRTKLSDCFYLLFNPWNKDDTVYMADPDQRNEYVINETGNIWIGSAWRHRGKPWNFGQFDEPVLEVALNLLDLGELGDAARNSPVSVIRCISALVNSLDDNGVLAGRWTETYPEDSTKPWDWAGSVAILKQFHETKKPVRYGQCWVFSGVQTTLLRALGIPTRSVTNFQSAHDCDCSMTIDTHFDEDGEPLDGNDDSVWNFHVWNESWLERVDLPEGYGGWQAHDATPQELSEGVYRCGPASLRAIKLGHVYLNHDVGFIFSEVNGDKVVWEVAKDGSMKMKSINRHAVGLNISTKAVGSSDRHDLTMDYKFPEGSAEEDKVLRFVNRFSTKRKRNLYKDESPAEVSMEYIKVEGKAIGDDVTVGVNVTNLTTTDINANVRLTLASAFYTGVMGKRVKGETIQIEVKAGEKTAATMTVNSKDYEKVMNAEAIFQLVASCRVMKSGYVTASKAEITLDKPDIVVKIPEKVVYREESEATLEFTNSTSLKLHNGIFRVEGSYLVTPESYPVKKMIKPGETVTVSVKMMPYRSGTRHIFATFSSDELAGVEGEATVEVARKIEAMETN